MAIWQWIILIVVLLPISLAALSWLWQSFAEAGRKLARWAKKHWLRWRKRPRGKVVRGTSSWFPGQTLAFHPVGEKPELRRVPVTKIHHHGGDFSLALVKDPAGHCRAYLIRQPEYGSVSGRLHESHRLINRDIDTYYACWSPEPTDPSQMATVLALWIAGTCLYLQRGDFPSPQEIVDWLEDESVPVEQRRFVFS